MVVIEIDTVLKEDSQLFKKIKGGTLYLDNIDLLSDENQLEILSLLPNDSHQIIDLKDSVPSDARIISSTNQDLEKLVRMGKFIERLYYRLSTVKIEIEPLRKRPEDIPLLIDYYITEYASEDNGHRLMALDNETIEKLCAHRWPGNVRELQNILKRILIIDGEEGNVSDLIGRQKNPPAIINLFDGELRKKSPKGYLI